MEQSEIRMIFANNLRYFRKKHTPPFTQEKLSELVGKNQNYIGLIEKGKSSPPLEMIALIAARLEIAPSLLLEKNASPENIQALNEIFLAVLERWSLKNDNPLDLHEALFRQKAYGPYWHFFAVSLILCGVNKVTDMIPSPCAVLKLMKGSGILDDVIDLAGYCTNDAFYESMYDTEGNVKDLNSHNWPKSGRNLPVIRSAVMKRLHPSSPTDKTYIAGLKEKLKMSKKDFDPRWTA